MSTIVAVHGIGQQFKGGPIIHREWWAALQSGVDLAGHQLTDGSMMVCPFYGHLFRPEGKLSVGDPQIEPEEVTDDEAKLLELWWHEAARLEPGRVVGPAHYDKETPDRGRHREIRQSA